MPRLALALFAVALVVGLGWLVKTAAGDDRDFYSLGVAPSTIAAKIDPGKRSCQEPIELPVAASAVVFPVATDGRPGQPLDVTVRTADGSVLGRGPVAPGYVDGSLQTAQLGTTVQPASRLAVCVRNDGEQPVFIYGSENVTSSRTITDGVANGIDFDLRFLYDEPRAFIDIVPDAFERAALFRPGWVGAAVYWALLALLALGAPLLLGYALVRAARDDGDYGETASIQSTRREQSDSASPAATASSSGSATGSSITAS